MSEIQSLQDQIDQLQLDLADLTANPPGNADLQSLQEQLDALLIDSPVVRPSIIKPQIELNYGDVYEYDHTSEGYQADPASQRRVEAYRWHVKLGPQVDKAKLSEHNPDNYASASLGRRLFDGNKLNYVYNNLNRTARTANFGLKFDVPTEVGAVKFYDYHAHAIYTADAWVVETRPEAGDWEIRAAIDQHNYSPNGTIIHLNERPPCDYLRVRCLESRHSTRWMVNELEIFEPGEGLVLAPTSKLGIELDGNTTRLTANQTGIFQLRIYL